MLMIKFRGVVRWNFADTKATSTVSTTSVSKCVSYVIFTEFICVRKGLFLSYLRIGTAEAAVSAEYSMLCS